MIINNIDQEMAADYWTLEAMRKYGGGFVKQLAELAVHADRFNMQKIKSAWPEYWDQYEKLGLELQRKYEEK